MHELNGRINIQKRGSVNFMIEQQKLHSLTNREKIRFLKNELSFKDQWENNTHTHTKIKSHAIRVPEGQEKVCGAEKMIQRNHS